MGDRETVWSAALTNAIRAGGSPGHAVNTADFALEAFDARHEATGGDIMRMDAFRIKRGDALGRINKKAEKTGL